jgi:MYXO-CTERM domain-containing protein
VICTLNSASVRTDRAAILAFNSAIATSNPPRLTYTLAANDVQVVPEPGSLALWGLLSLVGLGFWRRPAYAAALGRHGR